MTPTEPIADKVNDEDLVPTETEGYKAPAVKTLDELKSLDQDDAALNKWKVRRRSGDCAFLHRLHRNRY
jgi:hypothetical protein